MTIEKDKIHHLEIHYTECILSERSLCERIWNSIVLFEYVIAWTCQGQGCSQVSLAENCFQPTQSTLHKLTEGLPCRPIEPDVRI